MSTSPQPDMPPHSEPSLLELNIKLRQELDYAKLKIQSLEEQLRLERIAKYGKRSETLNDLQLELLDREPGVSSDEVAAESEREPITAPGADKQQDKAEEKGKNQPERRHPGRQKLPSHLERVEQIIACPAEECMCGHCGNRPR